MNENGAGKLEINIKIYPSRFVERHGATVILFFILLLGLTARLFFFTGINCSDDIFYLFDVRRLFDHTFVPGGIYSSRIGQFYPMYIFMSALGRSELAASSWVLICGLAEIGFVYLIGKTLFNKKAGLWAAFLLSIFPAHIIGSTRTMPDVPLSFFLTASFFFFAVANLKNHIKDSRILFFNFLSGTLLYAGFLVKTQAAVLAAAYFGIFIFLRREMKLKLRNFAFMAAGLLAGLLFEIIFYRAYGQPFMKHYHEIFDFFSLGAAHSNDTRIYPYYFLNREATIQIVDYSPGLIFYVVLPLAAYALFRKRSEQSWWLFIWFASIFLFLNFGSQSFHKFVLTNKESRFALYFTVPLFLLGASALPSLHKHLKTAIAVFLLLGSFHYAGDAANWWNYKGGPCACRKNDIKIIYSDLRRRPAKPVYIDDGFGRWLLDFYSGYQWDIRSILQNREPANIRDAYVILNISQFQAFPAKADIDNRKYTMYVRNVPRSWVKLKTALDVTDTNVRSYNPSIYYAPSSINDKN